MVVVLAGVGLLGCPPRNSRPAVHYDAVTVRWSQDVFGYRPLVSIDLTAETPMPHVGPHVEVEVACGQQVSSDKAFFMSLSDVEQGDKLHDTAQYLFHTNAFGEVPRHCDMVLSFDGGATAPAHYCITGTTVTPGTCP